MQEQERRGVDRREEMERRGRRQENKQRGEKTIRVYRGKRVDDITWKRERRRGKRVYIHSREGETVIGYVLKKRNRDKVERLEIGERVDSDHHPLVVCVRGNNKRKRRERGN